MKTIIVASAVVLAFGLTLHAADACKLRQLVGQQGFTFTQR